MSEDEIQLPKGDVTDGVVRVGDTVRRPHSDVSDGVAAYLAHLKSAGFDRAPRYLGRDDRGRDILTFLEGDVPGDNDPPAWATSTPALASVARLARSLHDASEEYRPRQPIRERDPSRPVPTFPAGEPRLIAQRDITPDVDVDVGLRLRTMLDAYGRDAVSAALLLEACELRFAGGYAAMKWAAEHLGGGWARMWDDGVGDVSRRRVSWFASVRDDVAIALG